MSNTKEPNNTASIQAASDCTTPAKAPSFACLWEVVNRFRNGQIDVELARIVVGQLDAALSQMDSLPQVSLQQEYTQSAEDRLAAALPDSDADVTAAAVPWSLIVSILLELAGRLR